MLSVRQTFLSVMFDGGSRQAGMSVLLKASGARGLEKEEDDDEYSN